MSNNIKVNSIEGVLSPLSLDNMTNRYNTSSGIYTFSSPDLWTLEKNLFYLLANSTVVIFQAMYVCKPDYASFDEYGTTQLAQLLMYVNNVHCIEDFDLTQMIIPSMPAIINILQDKIQIPNDVTKLEDINY